MITERQREAFSQWLRRLVFQTQGLSITMPFRKYALEGGGTSNPFQQVDLSRDQLIELMQELHDPIMGLKTPDDEVRAMKCEALREAITHLESAWGVQAQRKSHAIHHHRALHTIKHEYQARGLMLAINILRERLNETAKR
jgi:hypothetical protein